jgi:hypothetical protein
LIVCSLCTTSPTANNKDNTLDPLFNLDSSTFLTCFSLLLTFIFAFDFQYLDRDMAAAAAFQGFSTLSAEPPAVTAAVMISRPVAITIAGGGGRRLVRWKGQASDNEIAAIDRSCLVTVVGRISRITPVDLHGQEYFSATDVDEKQETAEMTSMRLTLDSLDVVAMPLVPSTAMDVVDDTHPVRDVYCHGRLQNALKWTVGMLVKAVGIVVDDYVVKDGSVSKNKAAIQVVSIRLCEWDEACFHEATKCPFPPNPSAKESSPTKRKLNDSAAASAASSSSSSSSSTSATTTVSSKLKKSCTPDDDAQHALWSSMLLLPENNDGYTALELHALSASASTGVPYLPLTELRRHLTALLDQRLVYLAEDDHHYLPTCTVSEREAEALAAAVRSKRPKNNPVPYVESSMISLH